MNRILLDTSAYSAYIAGHTDLQEPVRHASIVHLSVVAMGELLAGFLKGGRRSQNETRLREFVAEPRVRVLHVDDETAVRYAAIRDYLRRQGTPVPVNDVWIAATAAQHGLRLLTLDSHFLQIPQVIVDFIEPARPGPAA
jgi:tRNA(fMet)-specific endonuclease VapC